MAYLDRPGLKARVIMPAVDFDTLDTVFVDARLAIGSSEITGRLRKRYAAPFAEPVPEVVQGWLAAVVTPELYARRGWDPSEEQSKSILDAAERARAEMKEAADSVEGLWDLPLRADTMAGGIVLEGGPLSYSEASPYDHIDVQREALRGR